MAELQSKEIFQQLEQLHNELVQQRHSLLFNTTHILAHAKALHQAICEAGRNIEDDRQRSLMEAFAKYWGLYIFEIEKEKKYLNISIESYVLSGTEDASIPIKTESTNNEIDLVSASGFSENNYFCGRTTELEDLKKWIRDDEYRVLAILGEGGIGKTSLVNKLIEEEEIKEKFGNYILWISLGIITLYIDDFLRNLIKDLSELVDESQLSSSVLEKDTGGKISYLIEHYLSDEKHPCLIILDNFETVLRVEKGPKYLARYEKYYEGYEELLREVGRTSHYSCLILTSRDKPVSINSLEQDDNASSSLSPVRSLRLGELPRKDALKILDVNGLSNISDDDKERIFKKYRGNPLTLKQVARVVKEEFNGDIANFLKSPDFPDDKLYSIFCKQFDRLLEQTEEGELQQQIIYWLAIEQQPVLLNSNMLLEDLRAGREETSLSREKIKQSVVSLKQKHESWFENTGKTDEVALHSEINEYVIKMLVEKVFEELENESKDFKLLFSHALLKASAEAQVRDNQKRIILTAIIDRLINSKSSIDNEDKEQREADVESQLKETLESLKTKRSEQSGYAVGNVLNLLINLKSDFKGLEKANLGDIDCSGLIIRQAHFHDVNLHNVNFEGCELYDCAFSKKFSSPLTVEFKTKPPEERSPEELRGVVGDANGNIYTWKTTSREIVLEGKLEKDLPEHSDRVRKVIFDRKGQKLASASNDGIVKLWTVDSNFSFTPVKLPLRSIPLEAGDQAIWSLAFDDEGNVLVSASDARGDSEGLIEIWNLNEDSEQPYRYFRDHGHKGGVLGVSISGKTLVSVGRDRKLRLWNLDDRDGKGEFFIDGRSSPIDDNCLYEISNSEPDESSGSDKSASIRAVAFSPNQQWLVAGGSNGLVALWRVKKNATVFEPLENWENHQGAVLSLAFSPDGQYLASASDDESIQIWKQEGDSWKLHQRLWKHSSRVWSVSFSYNSEFLVSCSDDQTVRVWRVRDGSYVDNLQGYSSKVLSVAFNPAKNGQEIASGHEDQRIRVWEINRTEKLTSNYFELPEPSEEKTGHRSWVWSVAYSPSGKWLASGSDDKTIRIWEEVSPDSATSENSVRSRKCIAVLESHTSWIRSVAFSPIDEHLLVSVGDDKTIRTWDLSDLRFNQNSELPKKFPKSILREKHEDWIWSIAFSPDGTRLATASDDKTVKFWNIESSQYEIFEAEEKFLPFDAEVLSVCFSPNGQLIACGCADGVVRVLNISSQSVEDELTENQLGKRNRVWSVAFSPDGTMIASGGDDAIVRIWNVQTKRCLQRLGDGLRQPEDGDSESRKGHTSRIRSIAFYPTQASASVEEQLLASASEDETIKLWHKVGDKFEEYEGLRAKRPYEGLNIAGITIYKDGNSVTEEQKKNLRKLGAIPLTDD